MTQIARTRFLSKKLIWSDGGVLLLSSVIFGSGLGQSREMCDVVVVVVVSDINMNYPT